MARNTLRVLSLERLGTVFNEVKVPLKYTPRKFILDPPVRRDTVSKIIRNSKLLTELADVFD